VEFRRFVECLEISEIHRDGLSVGTRSSIHLRMPGSGRPNIVLRISPPAMKEELTPFILPKMLAELY
jgi:hypothetical protein